MTSQISYNQAGNDTIFGIPAVAERLADAARGVTLERFRDASLTATNKAERGFDPVTVADRDCESVMRKMLEVFRPDDGILGEEFGERPSRSGLTWVLDPIDGTRAFMSGAPTWGVLIAVQDDTGPVFGVIDQPHIGERFLGGMGTALLKGRDGSRQLETRAPRPLEQSTLFTTFPEIGTPDEHAAFRRVADRVRLTRYGMDCYAYALLALGQIDLVIEAGLQAYDIAAPIAVVEAAGGLVTDWKGKPVHHGGAAVAAANPEIHAEALELLQDHKGG
ncbi:MAG: histidinol-phosphatase [Pseudomonadota bacterium]